MKQLYYTITTLEPLILTQQSDDPNMYETMEYIRGSIIQGLFAQNYLLIKKLKKADSEFTRLIVRGGCYFSNAYPVSNNRTFFPTPKSLVREKYNPEIVHDLLNVPTKEQNKSMASITAIESDNVYSLTIRKEIRLHGQINDSKRISEEGILFNYQSISEGVTFLGHLTIENDLDVEINKEIIPTRKEIRIGRSSTSEYGKVRFDWVSENQKGETAHKGDVILTLLSDTIIYNDDGFSTLDLKFIGDYLMGSNIISSISRKDRIEGFLNIWKLRKPSENVYAAGSSFKLDKLPDNAEQLLNYGLGERTHEGFGQITFSLQDPKVLNYALRKDEHPTTNEQFVIPDLTLSILKSACFQRQKEIVTKKALEDADKTKPGITNHLIGKLNSMLQIRESRVTNLELLRKPAKDQLRKSHYENQSLFEHLIAISDGSRSLCSHSFPVEGQIIDLSGSIPELTQLYFEQYFNQLRRNNKNKDERHERR